MTMRHRRSRPLVFAAAAALVTAACSEPETTTVRGPGRSSPAAGVVASVKGDGSVVSRYAGARWFLGTVPERATEASQAESPIKIGFINIDNGPIAATPELHGATDAAFAFINAELGGVRGHPLQLIACESDLGVDKAQTCARKMVEQHVVAVLDGLNLGAGAATKVLEQNDIAWVGGIPLDDAEMRSPIAFQFSGGAPGAFAAFADHAAHVTKARRVAVIYATTPQVANAVRDYGIAMLRRFGVAVTDVPFDLLGDPPAAVNRAAAADPDAIIIGTADVGCPKVMQAVADLKLSATIYMAGSCADRKWIDQVGAERVVGTLFNIESRITQVDPLDADTEIYSDVIAAYGHGVNAIGAGTVAFRSAMNLYSVLLDQPGTPRPAGVIETFRAAKDRRSFDGHPYTCDGRQIPSLPSLCAAQEVIVRLDGTAVGAFSEVSNGWIDVPAVLARTR